MKTTGKTSKCPECGGIVRPGFTELVYELQYRVRISNVPANICFQCGEAFIPGRVAAEANRLANRLIEDVESFARSQHSMRYKKAADCSLRRSFGKLRSCRETD